jgi:hypothetical protein
VSSFKYVVLGIVLGAILTAGFTYWIERVKRRRLRRGALRLVYLQFRQAEIAIRSWAKKGWWGGWTDSATDPWASGDLQLLIASELRAGDWHIFQSGLTTIEYVGVRRDARRRETGEATPTISNEDLNELARALTTLRTVSEVLANLSGADKTTLLDRLATRKRPKPPTPEEVARTFQELSALREDSSPGTAE